MNIQEIINKTELFFQNYGYLTVFLGSLIEITPLGWVVPGGIILAIAGFFANTQTEINLISIIIAGSLGALFTFILSYFLGNKTGMWLVTKLHQEKNARFAKLLLKKHGGMILTTSMLANLTRFWVAYIAGVEKYHFGKFLIYAGTASITWVSLMSILGFIAGYERGSIENLAGAIGIVGWGIVALAAFVIYRSIKHEYRHFKEDEPHEENH